MEFKYLTHGIDTLEVAYYLDMNSLALDFEKLAAERDGIDRKKNKEGKRIDLGGKEFFLLPHGTSSGYPFVIVNSDCRIQFGEFNKPSFYVKYRSEALWQKEPVVLQKEFLAWAESLGLQPNGEERISRIDVCFDYAIPEIDFDENSFVTHFEKDQINRGNGKIQTFTLGRGDAMLRVYDKAEEINSSSHKTWFHKIWGQKRDVWRVEWQFRKKWLRTCGIITLENFDSQAYRLLSYFFDYHTKLCLPSSDTNRSRWPIHPWWQDLYSRAAVFKRLTDPPSIDASGNFAQRMQALAVIMYGYVKQVAALNSCLEETPAQNYEEIMPGLIRMLDRIHDPLTWKSEVTKRMDKIRFGHAT